MPRAGKRSCTQPTTAWIVKRISALSVDFLIVNPDTSIVAEVELDDATHDRQHRRAADPRDARRSNRQGFRFCVGVSGRCLI